MVVFLAQKYFCMLQKNLICTRIYGFVCFPPEVLKESLETPQNINFHVLLKCFTRVVLRVYLSFGICYTR